MNYRNGFLTFQQAGYLSNKIEEAWQQKLKWNDMKHDVRTARQDFLFVKDIWDSYNMPKNMVKSETLVGVLKREFSNIYACKVCRPLGDFKDYDEFSHKDVYEVMVENFMSERVDARGNKVSYVDTLYPYAKKLAEKVGYGRYSEFFSKSNEKFIVGISIMLYRSAIGIFLEGYINRRLVQKFENSAVFVYKAAPADMESQDIDGILYRRDNDEIVARVSIKTLNAFTDKSIFGTWRKPVSEGGKGKTLPDIYFGITSDEWDDGSKDRMRIGTITVNGKSMNDLIQASHMANNIAMAA